ncbi:glycosyltransferase family 2 protein [Nitratidesulfovibrio sp. D1]|uniref:glycosyltransferase family 2 protein n=1 Tax=Nitratidesulfovibrio sp. D1 TaxID=3440151 RepID=UPI003EBFC60B
MCDEADFSARQVGVMVVNFRCPHDTLACLGALSRLFTAPRRIVVVDNGSGDGSTEVLEKELAATSMQPRPELLALPDNLGFSGGNNAALRLLLQDSGCRAFWLLNSDAMPESFALDALCARLNALPRPGACGSLLVHTRGVGRVQCMSGGRLNRFFGTTRHLGGGLDTNAACAIPSATVEARLDYVCGASLLVSRAAVERVGLLDEVYFLYYEDVEWGIRMRRAGFDLGYAARSLVRHKEGGATGATSGPEGAQPVRSRFIDYLMLRNRMWLMRANYPLALPCVIASYLGVAARRCHRGQTDRLGLVVRAAWHGFVGRMGRPAAEEERSA